MTVSELFLLFICLPLLPAEQCFCCNSLIIAVQMCIPELWVPCRLKKNVRMTNRPCDRRVKRRQASNHMFPVVNPTFFICLRIFPQGFLLVCLCSGWGFVFFLNEDIHIDKSMTALCRNHHKTDGHHHFHQLTIHVSVDPRHHTSPCDKVMKPACLRRLSFSATVNDMSHTNPNYIYDLHCANTGTKSKLSTESFSIFI